VCRDSILGFPYDSDSSYDIEILFLIPYTLFSVRSQILMALRPIAYFQYVILGLTRCSRIPGTRSGSLKASLC
jgi:hypothetical protein